ncbi:MAG: radical SAM protein [Thermoanaerobaculia bacterium]
MTKSKEYPSYINLFKSGKLEERVRIFLEKLKNCDICPRKCGVDRTREEKGFCRTGRYALVSSYNLHFGEEPPISGYRGSGTIFFSFCNLSCIFCQNWTISHLGEGYVVSPFDLKEIMLDLQRAGAHNLNLVTPTHIVPQFMEALYLAIKEGFSLPIVYNSSGYDSVETLKLLDGVIDIYMPDAKYGENRWAEKLSGAGDYVEVSREALKEMYRQVGEFEVDGEGIAKRGVLVRHLILPENMASSFKVLDFLKENLPGSLVALLSQYWPSYNALKYPQLGRRITLKEYEEVANYAKKIKLKNLYLQK